jgi:hypothetical protein
VNLKGEEQGKDKFFSNKNVVFWKKCAQILFHQNM